MPAVPLASPERRKLGRWLLGIAAASVAWLLAYSQLTPFADSVVALLGLSRQTHFGEAVHFFLS